MYTIPCLESWNVANDDFSLSDIFDVHVLQILTWNSCPSTGIDDLLRLQSSHIAAPQCRQWCWRLPTTLFSHMTLKFQKKGLVHFMQTSLSCHCGFSLRFLVMSQTTILLSSEPDTSLRGYGMYITDWTRSLWPSKSYVTPFWPPMSQQIMVLS